ncbi:MAG: hypothetical protein M3Y27_09735, partial [Acidobacteriota bacterium]|nr:hypothetical protein [Acidobacteriota bacterium]
QRAYVSARDDASGHSGILEKLSSGNFGHSGFLCGEYQNSSHKEVFPFHSPMRPANKPAFNHLQRLLKITPVRPVFCPGTKC